MGSHDLQRSVLRSVVHHRRSRARVRCDHGAEMNRPIGVTKQTRVQETAELLGYFTISLLRIFGVVALIKYIGWR